MLAFLIVLFLVASGLGHLVRDRKGARNDREFYEELIATQRRNSDRRE
jgi:hypothetical protein